MNFDVKLRLALGVLLRRIQKTVQPMPTEFYFDNYREILHLNIKYFPDGYATGPLVYSVN